MKYALHKMATANLLTLVTSVSASARVTTSTTATMYVSALHCVRHWRVRNDTVLGQVARGPHSFAVPIKPVGVQILSRDLTEPVKGEVVRAKKVR